MEQEKAIAAEQTKTTKTPMKEFRLGLIGKGIQRSLSPKIHTRALSASGLKGRYELFDLASADAVINFLREFWHDGGAGLNVTAPYKELVARLIGSKQQSVNTLYRGKNFWLGASTDGHGFVKALSTIKCALNNIEKIIIIGSGGATKAILEHLLETMATPPSLLLIQRSSKEIKLSEKVQNLRYLSLADIDKCEALKGSQSERVLLVQATSAPSQGDLLSTYLEAFSDFRGYFMDLEYKPPSAIFESLKSRNPERTTDGISMLHEQAKASQLLWFKNC